MGLLKRLGFATPRGRRWWMFASLACLLVVGLLTAAAPTIVSLAPIRDRLIAAATRKINGRVVVGDLSLGWFTPTRVRGVEILPREGAALVALPSVDCDASVWDAITMRDLGAVRVDRPIVFLEFTDQGFNFVNVFKRPKDDPDAARLLRLLRDPPRSVAAHITNATVRVRGPKSAETWEVDGLNLDAGIVARNTATDTAPYIFAEPRTIVDHVQITPGMCNDALKYAAPILSGATVVSGEVSLDLDELNLPTEKLVAGTARGRLSLHRVDVGAGPLVAAIARVLGVPAKITLANEAVVDCRLEGQRVHHQGLEFGVSAVRVESSGWVGFDQSLDLAATLKFDFDASAYREDQPFMRALAGQRITLRVKGTLDAPKVEFDAADARKWLSLGPALWKGLGLGGGAAAVGDGAAPLEPPADQSSSATGADAAADSGLVENSISILSGLLDGELTDEQLQNDLPRLGVDVVQELIRLRQSRRAAREAEEAARDKTGVVPEPVPSETAGESPSPVETPETRGERRPLRRALERLLGPKETAPDSK